MAPQRNPLTRISSSASSVVSNIEVVAAAMDVDSSSEQVTASTPPTSVSDTHSTRSNKPGDEVTTSQKQSPGRRSKRARASVNYNVLEQFNTMQVESSRGTRNASGLSGRTLVNRSEIDEDDEDEDEEEMLNGSPQAKAQSPGKLQRRPSMKERVKKMASSAKSVLGKRTRDAVDAGRRKLGRIEQSQSPQQKKLLKELDMGTGNIWDEMDLDADVPLPPVKRAKISKAPLQEIAQPAVAGPMQKTSTGKKVKKWQPHGLYAGQALDFDPNKPASKKLQKKRPDSSGSGAPVNDENAKPKHKSILGFHLPMYGYLDEEKTRSFRIPYDVYAPYGKNSEKPKDWHKINKNRLVGDAKELWAKTEKMASSLCVCAQPLAGDDEIGCGDGCLNRIMQYECDDTNCPLPAELCSNRPFAEITARTKKGGAYDIGVEVVKTEKRGHGIRAARSFRPQQVIMEYTGEIITEEECQRRMREVYKDKSCYYLMELERNLVIDGTKGSMARFINHSCEPNCEVRMMKVNGTPRMAIFAGDSGIMTGEELTYDYNFDNFGETRQPCYCGAANCRGYLGKRLNADQIKKLQKEEAEKQRIAAEEAAKAAKKAQAENAKKDSRGPGWQGWVAVDDPKVKEQLREAKRQKEEAEKNSARAQRLANRGTGTGTRGSLSGSSKPEPSKVEKKKASPKRRRTVANVEELARTATAPAEAIEDESDEDVKIAFAKAASSRPTSSRRPIHHRTTSTGSKFTEDLEMEARPASRSSARTGIIKKTTVSLEIQRDTIVEGVRTGEVVVKEEDIAAGRKSFADELSNSGVASLSKVGSKAALAGEASKGDRAPPAKKQKAEAGGSIRSKVAAAVKSTGKTFRQSTLSFSKLG